MASSTSRPMGFLIVRAWMEGTDRKSFRAWIAHSMRHDAPETESAVSSPEELGARTRWWAEEFIATNS